jgi:hypothetical protein
MGNENTAMGLQDFPIWDRLTDRAPGLTVSGIDELMRKAWAHGFSAGVEDVRPKVFEAQRQIALIESEIGEIINRHLNHIDRRLRTRDSTPRTTIAKEREFMEQMADELNVVIGKLRAIGTPK